MILFSMAVVLTAAIIVIQRMPDSYESRSLVVVSGQFYDAQTNGAQIAAVSQQVMSRSTLEALIRRHNLYEPLSKEKIDAAAAQMEKEIKFDTKFRSDVAGFPESFTISYRHTSPVKAQQVLTDLVSIFTQANDTLRKQAAEEALAIKSEIAEVESRLTRTSYQRAASAAASSAANRAHGNLNRLRAERSAIESSLETLTDRQYFLERQIADQKQLITQQQELVRSTPPSDTSVINPLGALLKRRAELEAKLQEYSSQYTESHPRIIQTREQLAEINNRIGKLGASGEQMRASQTTPESAELRNLQRELNRMEVELDVVRREIARKKAAAESRPAGPVSSAPVAGSVGASPETSFGYDTLRERYSNLLNKQDSLQKWQLSSTGAGPDFFRVMDEPNLPQSPKMPNRRTLFLFALALALAAALIVAAGFEAPRLFKVSDDTDVQYYLGVPVVALIPETLTPVEQGQARRALLARKLLALAVGACAVVALVVLLNTLQLFQILGNR